MYMKKVALSVVISSIIFGATGTSASANEDVTAWRLFVSDHDKPIVNVIDAVDGDNIGTFNIKGPASLSRSESGATIFAIQGSENVVSAISSGIAFHDHGDHADIDVDAPKLLKSELVGKKPGHFVERQGKIAQWFDGENTTMLLSEHTVLDDKPAVSKVNIVAAHHGVAVPYDNYAVVSIPNPEDATKRPIGARVIDFQGKPVGADIPCPGLHGSAGSGDIFALACSTGLLLITQKNDAPKVVHLPYDKSLPEGSSSTLIGGKGMQYFIGNYGPDRIVLVDPTEDKSFRLIQLPTRRVHFTIDPVRAKYAYVITEDGRLHQIDVLKGEITKSVHLTEPYSMDGHWNDPRPRIAVADDKIYVTDPLQSKIHTLDAVSFKKLEDINVKGRPFNIVAVGGSGKSHGEAHGDGHSHESH